MLAPFGTREVGCLKRWLPYRGRVQGAREAGYITEGQQPMGHSLDGRDISLS